MAFRKKDPSSRPPIPAPPAEEMVPVPCCAAKIAVDIDTPVGAELACVLCGARLILRGTPGKTTRHFERKV